ncbi:protein of unknown function [Actinacidiphila yanglinensis]|uniref:DUF4185 domain-containing protein n=1 Tax=Actinacidiphila yanglinensis TaxID=310779 RepID=A0A1H6ALK3_9ACTN|nr:DUF4185 domain-containing protein [Actinacidiphila yanglinensis]SEG49421.1 protein of unknown function [Actinacidiphila yanglinensis]
MSDPSRTPPPSPASRPSRRTVLRSGLGLGLGATVAGAGLLGAAPAQAAGQNGTPLCDEPGDSASAQGLGSGDLGIPYHREHDNTWGYVFGDAWTHIQQGEPYIGSPVMLNQDSFDASGASPISFTWAMPTGGAAGQLFGYAHRADNGYGFEISRIPNDCIEFGGRTYIQYTSVYTWGGPDDPPWVDGHDGSLMSGVAYSDDYGVTWTDYDYHWDGDHRGINQSMYGMWSFAGIDPDGWLYIFSKRWNGTHRNSADGGAIQLFRIRPDDFRAGNFGAQQNWAYLNGSWQWTGSATPPSVILSGNNTGEFSVKRIGDTYCMSCFDVVLGAIFTRTAARPDAVWSTPVPKITSVQVPNLYGGYIHPGSASASSLTLIVSQWNGTVGAPPYWVRQFDGVNPTSVV